MKHSIVLSTQQAQFQAATFKGDLESNLANIASLGYGGVELAIRDPKLVDLDNLQGHFLYSWGTWGAFPGGFWGVHGFCVDQDGNFYVAEVGNGRVQKFRPRQGANPAFMVTKPVYAAWK